MLANTLEILISCQGHALIFVEREKFAAVKALHSHDKARAKQRARRLVFFLLLAPK